MTRREGLRRFAELLANDFDVEPPALEVAGRDKLQEVCGSPVLACYNFYEKKMYVGEDVDLWTFLHVFSHHLRLSFLNWDAEKFRSELLKSMLDPLYSMPHEAEAERFARVFAKLYRKVWEELVEKA